MSQVKPTSMLRVSPLAGSSTANSDGPLLSATSRNGVSAVSLSGSSWIIGSQENQAGWSAPGQLILFPLILLMIPDTVGIGFVLIFGLVNLAQWPVLIPRGLWQPVIVTIVLRTLLLIILLIELVQRCRLTTRAHS